MKYLADATRKWTQLNNKIDQRAVLFPVSPLWSLDGGEQSWPDTAAEAKTADE